MGKPIRNFRYTPTIEERKDNTTVYNPHIEMVLRQTALETERKRKEEERRLLALLNPLLYAYLNRKLYNGPTISAISLDELSRRDQRRKEREALKLRGEFLSKNLHLWNWSGPFMNTSPVTPLNAEGRLEFNKTATMSALGGASGVINPVGTLMAFGLGEIGGHYGAKVGKLLGNEGAGEFTGAMLLPFLLPMRGTSFSGLVKDDLIRTERANMEGLIVNRTAGLEGIEPVGSRTTLQPRYVEGKVVGMRNVEIPDLQPGKPGRFKPEDYEEMAAWWSPENDLMVAIINHNGEAIPLLTLSAATPNLVSLHLPALDMADKRQVASAVNHITLGTSIGDFPRGVETPHSYYTRTGSMEGYEVPEVITPSYLPYSPGSYFELLRKNGNKRGALRFMPSWIRSTDNPKTLNGEVFNNNAYILRESNAPVYDVPAARVYPTVMRGTVGQLFPWLYGTAHDTERILMGNMKRGKYLTVVDDLNEAANDAMGTSNMEVFRTDGKAIEFLYPYWFKKRGGKLINTFKYAKSNKS